MKTVKIHFSDEVYAELEAIGQRRGISVTDVLREAINTEKWIADNESTGVKFLIERDDKLYELQWSKYCAG